MECKSQSCLEPVPSALAAERLCLTHFLEHAYQRACEALGCCLQDQPVAAGEVEWLLSQVHYTVLLMVRVPDKFSAKQRDCMLELLLCLANLNEFMRHHSVRLAESG